LPSELRNRGSTGNLRASTRFASGN